MIVREMLKLGDVCEKITDYVASGSFAALKENVLITNEENYALMVKTADFSNGFTKGLTYTDQHGYEFLHNSNLFGGELILSNIGSIGKVFKVPYLNRPMTLASNSVMIKTANDGLRDYLYYFFLSKVGYEKLMSISSGTSMKKFNKTELKKLEVPIPATIIQKQIVSTLDKLQSIITHRQTQLKKLDELVKARFVEMFGTLQDNCNRYDIVSIEDVCSIIKDGTHQTPIYTEDNENGFKFLSSKDVMTQKIDWDNIKYIPAELHEKLYATLKPQRNDILMSKNGVNYGVAAVNDTDEIFDIYVSLALLRPLEIINPVYFKCVINSYETKRQFDRSIKGIGVPNLHLGEIKKTRILLPPIELQNQFADFVKQTEKSKEAVQKALDEAQLLFDSLMQKYFG